MTDGSSLDAAAKCRGVSPSLVFAILRRRRGQAIRQRPPAPRYLPPPRAGESGPGPPSPRCRRRGRAGVITTEGSLLNAAAWCKGVQPRSALALMLAPRSRSAAMTDGSSLDAAAKCRGVSPSLVFAPTSAPQSSSARTSSTPASRQNSQLNQRSRCIDRARSRSRRGGRLWNRGRRRHSSYGCGRGCLDRRLRSVGTCRQQDGGEAQHTRERRQARAGWLRGRTGGPDRQTHSSSQSSRQG